MASNTKEIWKQITALKGKTTKNYGVSNLGKLCSFEKSLNDKTIINLGDNNGFPVTTVRVNKKSIALFPHREVANYFIKKSNPKYKFVLHLDHNKSNNEVSNLKWASQEQQSEHNKSNPVVKNAISQRISTGAMSKKLSEAKVIKLKTEIYNPKRKLTLKQLAEKYDIAEMNLYRIKSGVFWYHIHVEGEPVHEKYKAYLKNVELGNKQAIKNKIIADKKLKLKETLKKQNDLIKLKIEKEKSKNAKVKKDKKKDKKKETKVSKKSKKEVSSKKKKKK
jgi:uncharacterized protein (UPF0305 family)